ncbi:MAG: hypothetical protein ACRD2W_03750 [Acidimicrobiales bacterium]
MYLGWGDEVRLEPVRGVARLERLLDQKALYPPPTNRASYPELAALPAWTFCRPPGRSSPDALGEVVEAGRRRRGRAEGGGARRVCGLDVEVPADAAFERAGGGGGGEALAAGVQPDAEVADRCALGLEAGGGAQVLSSRGGSTPWPTRCRGQSVLWERNKSRSVT